MKHEEGKDGVYNWLKKVRIRKRRQRRRGSFVWDKMTVCCDTSGYEGKRWSTHGEMAVAL